MATFNSLDKLRVDRSKTVEFETNICLKEDAGNLTFITLSATEKNEKYFNAMLKGRTIAGISQRGLNAKTIRMSREEDIQLFAKYVIQGWKNCFDDDGKEVLFSREEAEKLFEKVIEVIPEEFNKYRTFCGELSNWREDLPDAPALAKNS